MRPTDHEMELEPGPPNHDDACMVCDKIDCICPPEDETTTQGVLEALRVILPAIPRERR